MIWPCADQLIPSVDVNSPIDLVVGVYPQYRPYAVVPAFPREQIRSKLSLTCSFRSYSMRSLEKAVEEISGLPEASVPVKLPSML